PGARIERRTIVSEEESLLEHPRLARFGIHTVEACEQRLLDRVLVEASIDRVSVELDHRTAMLTRPPRAFALETLVARNIVQQSNPSRARKGRTIVAQRAVDEETPDCEGQRRRQTVDLSSPRSVIEVRRSRHDRPKRAHIDGQNASVGRNTLLGSFQRNREAP